MVDPALSSESSDSALNVEVVGRGRYAVTGILGEGGQGQTLEAVDKRDGRLVAIKRFRIKGAASWKDVELAEREARVLAALEHPSLPRYVEHFEEAGALYLVMDRVMGETLLGFTKRGPLDQHAVVQLLNDMADVLDYLQLRAPPIIHRDIKPGNILQREDGSFALVDFGSVRDRLKPEGGSTVVGTFGYMAPEQFQGRALPVTDIYGVGATALALLTGRDPDQLPHQGLALDVQSALGGQVDERLVHVLSAMLRPDPDLRARRLSSLLVEHRLRLEPGDRAREMAGAPAWTETSRGRRHQHAQPPHAAQRPTPRADQWQSSAWQPHPRDFWLFRSVFILPLILLALQVAKLATWALFGVLLPVLFNVLSIFFGRGLQRTALTMSAVGRRGRSALGRASRRVVERSDGVAARRHRVRQSRRVRVDAHERRRVPEGEASDMHADEDPSDWSERDARSRKASLRR